MHKQEKPMNIRVNNNSNLSTQTAGRVFLWMFILIFGLMPTLIGLGFSGIWRVNWAPVEATVVAVDMSWNRDGGRPTFEYTFNGEEFTYRSSVSTNPPLRVGATRTLRVNPESPREVGRFMPAFLLMSLALPVGIAIGIFGNKSFQKQAELEKTTDFRKERIRQLEEELAKLS